MAEIDTGALDDLKDLLRTIEASFFPTLQQVFTQQADVIKQLQQDQLFAGEDNEGVRISPSYAPTTVRIKIGKSQPVDRVTLKDSGDYYDEIKIIATPTELIIESTVEYAKFLTEKYGQEILGIQEMNLEEFIEKFVRPELIKTIDDLINKSDI